MEWTHILIHHSLTQDSGTVSWAAIRRYHVDQQGWNDIGYHFGVELVGTEYEAFVGRPLDIEGAHCREAGMNRKAIGICVVGNYDLILPSVEALTVLTRRLIIPLMRTFHIPKYNIGFHRDFATYKSCPGTKFTKQMILSRIPEEIV